MESRERPASARGARALVPPHSGGIAAAASRAGAGRMERRSVITLAAGLACAATACAHAAAIPGRAPAADAAPALVGAEWAAEDIGGRGVVDRARVSLAFTADGKVSGSGGCNRIAGSYTLAGETIAFGQMVSTMMACAPAVGEQE